MNITNEFRQEVIAALMEQRARYGGSDASFAKTWSINPSVFSRLKKSGADKGLLKDIQYLQIGRELNVSPTSSVWNIARTEVFEAISNDVAFCQQNAKAMIFVDECEIGKTVAAKYLSKSLKNCFYVDCSQSKTKNLFIRALALALGVDPVGKYAEIKANIKYYLTVLENPIILLDEGGDLEYPAFLEIKEFWNATDGYCGWYMIGADGLRAKWERGISAHKVGYRELFSRFSGKYMSVVPANDRSAKDAFYKKLITAVLEVNTSDKAAIPALVKKCMATDANGQLAGLRRAHTLLTLKTAE
ncbi:MAG TPA: hypothetical protein DIW47_11010 [Bacteroidetes bacterium]|nr:hypothetical protein [Bacteroidota bacterium]